MNHVWVVVTNIFIFTPTWDQIPILTNIFTWVETTKEMLSFRVYQVIVADSCEPQWSGFFMGFSTGGSVEVFECLPQ